MKSELIGKGPLEKELKRLDKIQLDKVAEKSAVEMFNRAKSSDNPAAGGTPVDTREMQMSVTKSGHGAESDVGYTKDYAPHNEFGHRTRGGGYVQGRHFLKRNMEIQQPILKKDAIAELRGK